MAFRHCLGLINYKGARVGANESRRHLTHYTKGMCGAAPFRARLTAVKTATEVLEILSDLSLQQGGTYGKERFLTAIEQDYLKYGKHPSERHGDRENSIQPKVDVIAVAPIAIP